MSTRNAVLQGDIIVLSAWFKDAAGDFVDPTPSTLKLSIYPPGKDPRLGAELTDAWVYDVTLEDDGSGPQVRPGVTIEKVAVGKYTYDFAVPEDADLGGAFDRWEGTVNLYPLDETFSFVVVGGGSVGTNVLYENNIVYIMLDSTIASTSGATLGEDVTYAFTTTYNPLYSSARQVRLDLGPFVSNLPDDLLNFAIFEGSKMADINTFVSAVNQSFFDYMKQRYSLLTAELILLEALMGDVNLSARLSKTLGDLSVSRGGNISALFDKANKIRQELDQVRLSLQTGADIAPGTSLKPSWTVKGANADDAMTTYRQWEPPNSRGGYTSGANDRSNSANTDYTTTTRRGFRSWRRK